MAKTKTDTPVEQHLYLLRHKRGHAGIQLSMVKARSREVAEQVGQTYCNQHMGFAYIKIEDAIVADESVLGAVGLQAVLNRIAEREEKERKAKAKADAAENRPERIPLKDNPRATATGNNDLDDLDDEDETEAAEESGQEEAEDTESEAEEEKEEEVEEEKPKRGGRRR